MLSLTLVASAFQVTRQDEPYRYIDDVSKAEWLANWALAELPKYSHVTGQHRVANVRNIELQMTKNGHPRYRFDAELVIGNDKQNEVW